MKAKVAVMVVLASMAVSGVAAQQDAFFTVTATILHPVDMAEIDPNAGTSDDVPVSGQSIVNPADACAKGGGHFTTDPVRSTLRFREGPEENGCAEARISYSVPSGARYGVVVFDVDRVIDHLQGGGPLIFAHQEVRLYHGAGRPDITPVYSPELGSDLAGKNVQVEFSLGLAQAQLDVGWRFHEAAGPSDALPGVPLGHSLSSTVTRPVVRFEGIAIEAVAVIAGAEQRAGERVDLVDLILEVPPSDEQQEIQVVTAPTRSVRSLTSPSGQKLDPGTYTDNDDGVTRTIVILPATIAEHGSGRYIMTFDQVTPLTANLWLVPAAILLTGLPAVTGALAAKDLGVFDRRAQGGFRMVVTSGRATIFVLGALYVALVLWGLIGPGWRVFVTLPLQLEMGIAIAASGLLALGFLAVGLLWKVQIGRVMEHTLEEQQAVNYELSRSNEELERFAYVASHDLQEPLRSVYGYAQLLQDRYGKELDDDGREFLGFVVRGADRMSDLVSDLLAYSRVEKVRADQEQVDTAAVVADVITDLSQQLRGVDLEVETLPVVYAQSTLIRQLFQNLLTNAVRFASPDRPLAVKVRVRTEGNSTVFQVSDTGIGIAPEDRQKVFVIFQRLHGTEIPGTGVGLALCRKIVEGFGGRIWITATRGGGATFNFTLPLEDSRG